MLNVIVDDYVKWRPYVSGDILCDRFPLDLWHEIAGDIHSDKEWEDFVLNYGNSIKCWVLERLCKNDPIAFIYAFNEDGNWQKVSIHGGGWGNPLMYYRGYILMIKHLLGQGYKVRTYCQLSNAAAIRFDRSVGFVPYRYTEEEVFMWISHKRLENSKLYKRFYK